MPSQLKQCSNQGIQRKNLQNKYKFEKEKVRKKFNFSFSFKMI